MAIPVWLQPIILFLAIFTFVFLAFYYFVPSKSTKKTKLLQSLLAALIFLLIPIGLGFIRPGSRPPKSDMAGLIKAEMDPPIPSEYDPISLSRDAVIIMPRQKEVIKVAILGGSEEPAYLSISCIPDLGESDWLIRPFSDSEKFKVFTVVMEAPLASDKQIYMCTVSAGDNHKDLTVAVR